MHVPRPGLLILVLVLIFGSIWYLEDRKVDSGATDVGDTSIHVGMGMTAKEKAMMYEAAKEISTPDAFINVDTISVMDEVQKGNVVLVDFWTYSCINCQRTLPYLNAWHEKYGDKGLSIIGVHTPEFEFEKELVNVQRAVNEFGVEYPVVLDNDYSTWRAYNNRYWPRKYLVDIDGFIVYDHIGEGAYEETEMKIVELLKERAARLGEDVNLEMGGAPLGVDAVDFSQVRTPEIYFGYSRVAQLANVPQQMCFGATCSFALPETLKPDSFALGGDWRIEEERAVLVGDNGQISLHFSANKVNIVAEVLDGPVTAEVLLDGAPIGDSAGSHVTNGVVTIDEPGLYNLVDLGGDYSEHTLDLRIKDAGLSAFTFTFG